MQSIILWREDELNFEPEEVEHIFRTQTGFDQVRFNEPGGALIEAQYSIAPDDHDYVLVRLAGSRRMISISRVSDVSLHAALAFQQHLSISLRIMNDDYTFDLKLSDYTSVSELNAAIDAAERGL